MHIKLGDGKKRIGCLAKVCRVEEDSLENVYTIVAYFLDISSADRVVISKFVEESEQQEDQGPSDKKTANVTEQ